MTKRLVIYSLALLILFNTIGCGYIMYPERRGQVVVSKEHRKLDVGVVVLDSIGLLFFLIPGIVSFAVDYNHGTLYLPSNDKVSSLDRAIYIGKDITNEKIINVLEKELKISIDAENIVRLDNNIL